MPSGISACWVALPLLSYAIYKEDPVFIVGQGAGLLIYSRNLYFIRRSKRADGEGTDEG